MKICTSVLTCAVVAAGALLQVGTATPVRAAETAGEALNSPPLCPAGNVSALRYNNPGLTVDLGVGLWGIPIPYDYDGDGVKDLLVSCPDRPYKGLYYFKNIGTAKKPLFAAALRISEKGMNNIRLSEVDGTPYVLSNETEHLGFFEMPYAEKQQIEYEGEVLGATYKKSRSNMWNYVDWDNDGDKDIVVGIDTWDDYGWDNAYGAEGRWARGPLTGYVDAAGNRGGDAVTPGQTGSRGEAGKQ